MNIFPEVDFNFGFSKCLAVIIAFSPYLHTSYNKRGVTGHIKFVAAD